MNADLWMSTIATTGYCASVIIIIMGIFGKFGAVFAAMPSPVLGGMQTFLYSTIAISGLRILATISWTRRNRFILSAALGLGLLDIVVRIMNAPVQYI